MKTKANAMAAAIFGMLFVAANGSALGGDDAGAAATARFALPTLDDAQRQAVGIEVRRPVLVTIPARTPAIGLVLDPAQLVREFGDMDAAQASEHAAAAESDRLQRLYGGGAGASLKMLEAARAAVAKARADAQLARAQVALHWAPLLSMPDARRRELIGAAASGRVLLLRADVLGHQSMGLVPQEALVDVDGVRTPGRVLGVLREVGESQSIGVMVAVEHPPQGLGVGARVPVDLVLPRRSGRFIPRAAVLYGEGGAYVYKQRLKSQGDREAAYEPVKIDLLLEYGNGWLVDGVHSSDEIVVHGAAALWSLQGLGKQPADDDD